MYYESYTKKPSRKGHSQRPSFGAWLIKGLFRLIALLLALILLCGGILYAIPVSFFRIEPEGVDLSLTDGLPANRLNVLLLGMDQLHDQRQRSDSIIVASLGYNSLRLTSFLRDTLVDISGHGSGKLNSAYAHGGPELVMKTLNESFDLNLMHYIAVDFVALVQIVDAIGGVEIPVSEAEMTQINNNVLMSRKVFRSLGYQAKELTQYGDSVLLDGLQALGYARIRKIDSDFRRASRQRTLLSAMLKKIRDQIWNPFMLVRLSSAILNCIKTNLTLPQLISLGEKALVAGEARQLRLPVDGSYTDNGSSIKIQDRSANIAAFQKFTYE